LESRTDVQQSGPCEGNVTGEPNSGGDAEDISIEIPILEASPVELYVVDASGDDAAALPDFATGKAVERTLPLSIAPPAHLSQTQPLMIPVQRSALTPVLSKTAPIPNLRLAANAEPQRVAGDDGLAITQGAAGGAAYSRVPLGWSAAVPTEIQREVTSVVEFTTLAFDERPSSAPHVLGDGVSEGVFDVTAALPLLRRRTPTVASVDPGEWERTEVDAIEVEPVEIESSELQELTPPRGQPSSACLTEAVPVIGSVPLGGDCVQRRLLAEVDGPETADAICSPEAHGRELEAVIEGVSADSASLSELEALAHETVGLLTLASYEFETGVSSSVRLAEQQPVRSPLADLDSSWLCGSPQPTECEAEAVECEAEAVECEAEAVECEAEAVECEAEAVECEAEAVECEAEAVECEAEAVECEAEAVECEAEAVECEAEAVECEAEAVECEAEAVECEAEDPGSSIGSQSDDAAFSWSESSTVGEPWMGALERASGVTRPVEWDETKGEDSEFSQGLTEIPLGSYELDFIVESEAAPSAALQTANDDDGTSMFVNSLLPIEDGSGDAFLLPLLQHEPVTTKPTLYRERANAVCFLRTDVERLAERLSQKPYWREPELCRDLRALAGVELTPIPAEMMLHTPPPCPEIDTDLSMDDEHHPFELVRKLKTAGCA
jgi:hypothetical protein